MRHGFLAFGLTALLLPQVAWAQDAPDEAARHSAAVAERGDDDITLQLNAGTTFAYGNARSFALNVGGAFALRQAEHAFVAEVGWLLGFASTRNDPAMMDYAFGDFGENANNLTGRLRYDYFITPEDALFVVARGRRDPFANLEPRVQAQAGYLRNLFREENHRFWVEVGVDFTYDNFALGAVDVGGGLLSTDRSIFSARAFVGYTNEINEILTYRTGLEVLWTLVRAPTGAEPAHLRFEWVNQFRSKIEDWLQISLDVTGRLDSQPPGQVEPWNQQDAQPTDMLDILATLNLVGAFDLDGEPVEEEAEEEEPECPVCEEPAPDAEADEVEEPEAEEPEAEEPEAEGSEAAEESDADESAESATDAEAGEAAPEGEAAP